MLNIGNWGLPKGDFYQLRHFCMPFLETGDVLFSGLGPTYGPHLVHDLDAFDC